MPWRRSILALTACVAGPALSAPTQTTTIEAVSGPVVVDKTAQTEDVRFRDDGSERMTVPVRLSGTGPYRFLVDTGADHTAVSRESRYGSSFRLAPARDCTASPANRRSRPQSCRASS